VKLRPLLRLQASLFPSPLDEMKPRKILISPLNWGFGHAGRMIPLALELHKKGHEIIFGIDACLMEMVAHELPGIEIIEIPGIRIKYSRFIPSYLSVLLHLPHIIVASFKEHILLKNLVEKHQPDVIISDNRFGFYHKKILSVYVTHMLRIPFPKPFRFLEFTGIWMHRHIIRKFDLCLVPDYKDPPDISGRLSHGLKLPENAIYAGPLSRFSHAATTLMAGNISDPYLCLILSGPEPQCSKMMIDVISVTADQRVVILSGRDYRNKITENERITFIHNPDTETMKRYITGSSMVISRSGYTTLMELISLHKGAVIIPTPGQTEQEYLCKYHDNERGFIPLRQCEIAGIKEILAADERKMLPLFADSHPLLDNVLNILSEKEKQY